MKHVLLTISLIFGATAVSAEPLKGDAAINIIENGKIIMQRVAEPDEVTPTGYKASLTEGSVYLTVLYNGMGYLCSSTVLGRFGTSSSIHNYCYPLMPY